jgi:hypothetical protein
VQGTTANQASHAINSYFYDNSANRNFYAIDMSILASALLCAVTGIIKWPGLIYSLGMSYDILPMEAFTLIHDWMGIVMVVLALAHVVLHWRWLVAMTGKYCILVQEGKNNEKT